MNYAHSAFNFIMKEPDNKQCLDCGTQFINKGSLFPTFCSVNNGVIICEKCAQYHRVFSFGTGTTTKSLISENWNDDEVMYIQVSGNKRFINLMKEYNIPFNQSIEYKYSVMAADYHRQLVKIL